MIEHFDLVVVGTGMHGIAMAKTYIQIHPESNILLVDSADSIGGSWAAERLYPGLKTNNVLGSYEFSDFPMAPKDYSAVPGGHIPGGVVHDYLDNASAHYGIKERCRLGTLVESASLTNDGTWSIQLRKVKSNESSTYLVVAKRLVIAAGLTSEPNMPTFAGQETFGGQLVHSKQLKERATELARCKSVVVIGGNKSAWDACYNAAQHGSQVTMVIRPSGGGPSYVWPKAFKWGPWWTVTLASLSSTRLFTAFDPTLYRTKGPLTWWSQFLHTTGLGAIVRSYFWTALDRKIRHLNGYKAHPELAKLEPWATPFWIGNSLSIHNYETDWFQLVRDGKIKVCIAEVDCLSSGKVKLTNGEELDAEALVCCTGWKSRSIIRFQNDPKGSLTNSDAVLRDIEQAKHHIADQVAYLETMHQRTPNAPEVGTNVKEAPFACLNHLYRFMVPWQPSALSSANMALIGTQSSVHAILVAQVQALWITAFFDGNIPSLSKSNVNLEEVRYDAILNGVYGMLRRPKECGGAADKHPDLVFDSLPYIDCLLSDLGLRVNRKAGIWSTVFDSHKLCDYEGLVEEYIAVNAAEKAGLMV